MIVLVLVLGTAFGLAAYFGTQIGARICAGRAPFADGPSPIDPPAWPFAAFGALVGAAAALHGDGAPQFTVLWLLTIALSAGAFADFRRGIVPDLCTLPPLAALVAGALLRHDLAPAAGALLVGFPFALAAAVSRGRGMGWGDVKLAALGGALLGAHDATFALFGACLAAYAWAMFRRRAAQPTALAPYLIGALAIALVLNPVR